MFSLWQVFEICNFFVKFSNLKFLDVAFQIQMLLKCVKIIQHNKNLLLKNLKKFSIRMNFNAETNLILIWFEW